MTHVHVWMPLIRTGTGAEVYTWALARGLRARGHRVTVSAVPHLFQFCPWLAPIAPPRDADVVLANSWTAAAFASSALPVVSVCHLVVHDERLKRFKSWPQRLFHSQFVMRMEGAAVQRAATNVAVSPMVARQMKRLLGAQDVVTVNNGVDTDYFCPGAVPLRDLRSPFRLLFVGKPSLRKGFDIVTQIVERLGEKVEFTCAGAEPGPNLPRPPGRYLGVLDKEALREAYRSADLLLFPSRMEGLSLAVAEAMACGLPILTCEGSSMDEFVPPEGGIVCDQSDIDGFVSEIERLMNEPEWHARMRALSREHAVRHLSENQWVAGMENVLVGACR